MSNPENASASAPASGSDADSRLANRLICALSAEMIYKADMFEYLCWLEEKHVRATPEIQGTDYLCMASDGTTCWGKTYADAVKVAMHHDKELYDAVQNLVLPEAEHQNDDLSHSGDNPKG